MPLADKDTSMVDALGKTKLEDLGLQPPLHEILNLQAEDVIQLHLTLVKYTNPDETPQQRVTCKETMEMYNLPLRKRTNSQFHTEDPSLPLTC